MSIPKATSRCVLAKPVKLYIVMGAKGLPDESVLENVFARKSAMAEVGPASGGGTEVSLEGVYCTLKKATRPADVPKHILPNETEPHGLTSEEAKSLASSTHYVSVSCLPDRELPLRGLPQYAEKIAEGIADVMDGFFPHMFKEEYPDGVKLDLYDKRETTLDINNEEENIFSGVGNLLEKKQPKKKGFNR